MSQNQIVKKMKPTSAGVRHQVRIKNPGLAKCGPFSQLVKNLNRSGGRNNQGRITTRHQGGGHKRLYRIIDWKRNDKDSIVAKVERLEYDPNRTAHIALLCYADGVRRYVLAWKGIQVGDKVLSGPESPIKEGNCLPLTNIPVGTTVHCVEMRTGQGAKIARSAGSSVQILAKEGTYCTVRLKSGEVRKVPLVCRATVGEIGNSAHNLRKLGKAGASRWRGRRPTVRGVAMNPVDHPLGGGEGKSSGGRVPCDPWGRPKGKKTRKRKAASNKFIVRRRDKTGRRK